MYITRTEGLVWERLKTVARSDLGAFLTNPLDEMTGPVNAAGRDVNVIDKQIPVTVGTGTQLFEIALWAGGPVIILILGFTGFPAMLALLPFSFLPGVVFLFMKAKALSRLRQLEQKIQGDASQIDNYLEQRVVILQNTAKLVATSVDLDKDVMKNVASLRSGGGAISDADRNALAQTIDRGFSGIHVAVEAYPDLKAHAAIADAMQQNSYLQQEITAARTLYNDSVTMWNQDIFAWPTNQIVAARNGLTTRVPFSVSAETKAAARGVFF